MLKNYQPNIRRIIKLSPTDPLQPLRIYHFNNGNGGGAYSVIKNLLRFSTNSRIENHIIYTINKDLIPHFFAIPTAGAATEQVFYYSPSWNFYYTCRELSKLLPDDEAIIIANDWLELGMASNLGLQNKVIQILHGDYDYYYNLATTHSAAIDNYITVAPSIKEKLSIRLQYRKEDIHYLRFPVPVSICSNTTTKELNTIIFIGRCSNEKGYHLLPAIAKSLAAQQINMQWHIVGELKDKHQYPWDSSLEVFFHGTISNEAVCKLLCKMQLFILPSVAEGMPISLIESMKAGVIPVVNHLPGGILELVHHAETGFLINGNCIEGFVETIKQVVNDEVGAALMGNKCKRVADELFEPVENTSSYEEIYLQIAARLSYRKPAKKIYGSRLDHPNVPNWLVKSMRSNIIPNVKN